MMLREFEGARGPAPAVAADAPPAASGERLRFQSIK